MANSVKIDNISLPVMLWTKYTRVEALPSLVVATTPVVVAKKSTNGKAHVTNNQADIEFLVERLKPALINRIAPYQSSFVPGRKIRDNILVAKELPHSMKKIQVWP